jgi:hypothetical protein
VGVFRGASWAELAEHFAVPATRGRPPADLVDSARLEATRQRLVAAHPVDIAAARAFVAALADESVRRDHLFTVWRGLLAVTDDMTFGQALAALLPLAWS